MVSEATERSRCNHHRPWRRSVSVGVLLQLSSISTKPEDERFSGLLHPPAQKFKHSGFRCKDPGSASRSVNDEPEFQWYNCPRELHLEKGNEEGLVRIQPAHQSLAKAPLVHTYFSYTINDLFGPAKHYPIGGIRRLYEPVSNHPICLKLFSGQALSTGLGPAFPFRGLGGTGNEITFGAFVDLVSLSEKDVKRLELAGEALKRRPLPVSVSIHEEIGGLEEETNSSTIVSLSDLYPWDDPALSYRAPNFTGKVFLFFGGTSTYLRGAMILIPAAYGLVHLAALGIHFPSFAERRIWEISCYFLVATAGLLAILFFLSYLDRLFYRHWKLILHPILPRRYFLALKDLVTPISLLVRKELDSESFVAHALFCLYVNFLEDAIQAHPVVSEIVVWLLFVSLVILGGATVLAYTGARFFIVVDSFISLRQVPVGVYETPLLDVMGNFPHL